MGGDLPGLLQKEIPIPKTGNGTFPAMAIGNRMEVSSVRIPLEEPILATPLSPEDLLPTVNLHERVFKGIALEPLLSG
jgi:hypothetical protein